MYHHHSQQRGPPPFSNGSRPPHHQPPPNQHQNRSSSDMQMMGFQFPRPTQLPDELESALAIHGPRDMDHRLIDHMTRPNQHQSSNSGMHQHGSYGSNPITLASDNMSVHQQEMDWSSYQPPPNKLFSGPPPSAGQQPHQHQGSQQQAQASHAGTGAPSWKAPVSDPPVPRAWHLGGGRIGGVDGQVSHTPESAGSILASFGLSNEDLEVLSHYPDDQLTPDTLPFILRDIQINKSGNQNVGASTSSFSHGINEMPLLPTHSSSAPSHSPAVPSLLTVTQTAGKVIDYGHASRAKEESGTRETFKREQLSSERTVKMYPSLSSSLPTPKVDKAKRRQVRVEKTDSSKHGDRDYRRSINDHRKSNRSPGREFPPSFKSRNIDRDYRREIPKPKPSSETRKNAPSRRSLSSSSGSKPHSSSRKLPTPTMISDFSAVSPKVYPHTCSLCHIQCDQEKDWVDHINTVNHTAACRDLRNKYPEWKPNVPSQSGQHGSRGQWDPKDTSPSNSLPQGLSSPIPPHGKQKPNTPHREHNTGHQLGRRHFDSHRNSSREHRPDKRTREASGDSARRVGKYPQNASTKSPTDTSRHLSKSSHHSKHGPHQPTKTGKTGTKPGTRMTSARPPAAKKKKKSVAPAPQEPPVADCLVYLSGIPKDASEQELTDWLGSFGKINNLILIPCSELESEKDQGQKASVCMVKMEDAQALANATDLSIRDQPITASTAKRPEPSPSADANSSDSASEEDRGAAGEKTAEEADHKAIDEKSGSVLITGLPESKCSQSDIMGLLEPFGTPSDVLLAAHIGKALVCVPNMDIAGEIVKVNAFSPMKIQDCELKMSHVKQRVGLHTPVALFNLLMGSVDQLESSAVAWGSLLVISNVPDTPSGSSEVLTLVRRFGTVIKTLVLTNVVICEMATGAMALSVNKRFQKFPCIIRNNPLLFSRRPDPKANTQAKVISANIDSSEDKPANGKDGQMAKALDKDPAQRKDCESLSEGMEKEANGKDKTVKSPEQKDGPEEALVENTSDDVDMDKDTLVVTDAVGGSPAAPDISPEVQLETDGMETAEGEPVRETEQEEKGDNDSDSGNDKTPAGEEIKPSSTDGQTASQETLTLELPKVTQEMVDTLLVECRTRTASNPNGSSSSAIQDQKEAKMEAEQGEAEDKQHTEDEAEEDMDDFPFDMSEFVTVDEVGDTEDLSPSVAMETSPGGEDTPVCDTTQDTPAKVTMETSVSDAAVVSPVKSDDVLEPQHVTVPTADTSEPAPSVDAPSVDPPAEASMPLAPQSDLDRSQTQQPTCQPEASDIDSTLKARPDSADETEPLATPSAPVGSSSSPGAGSGAESGAVLSARQAEDEQVVVEPKAAEQHKENGGDQDKETVAPAVDKGKQKRSEEQTSTDEESAKKKLKTETTKSTDGSLPPSSASNPVGKQKRSEEQTTKDEESAKKPQTTRITGGSLPPYSASNPVGMEYLLSKTGFFCKVCDRFFTGVRKEQISHCKTHKHYENVQKYLKTTEKAV